MENTCWHSKASGTKQTLFHQLPEVLLCYCSLLDIVRGEEVANLRSHCESISGCLLDAHHLELMTSGHDGCTHTWDISAIGSPLQLSKVTSDGSTMPQPKPSVRRLKSRPNSVPLQDLQNVMEVCNNGEPELAPLPSHLFSPRQAVKIPSIRRVDTVTMSVPVLNVHAEGIKGNPPEGCTVYSGDICVENEEAERHPRLSRAVHGRLLGRRDRGSSMSSLRHSIAGHSAAELRREELQRQRAHKEWQRNYMTLLEQLRTELEAVRMLVEFIDHALQTSACTSCCRAHIPALDCEINRS